jgi:creatinine amidohydrolase
MRLADCSWPAIADLDRDTPVIFPVAALEQHGRHLPVFTDSLLLGEIARRAEARLGTQALFAPLQWLGNSHHHLDFPGTLSAEPRLYLDLLAGLAENFLAHGFRRLLFLNGHGGNDVPGKQAVFELRQRHRARTGLLLLFATYWHLAPEARDCHPGLVQPELGHACEWETSMVLSLDPSLVGDHAAAPDIPFGTGFAPASRGWIMGDRSVPGHIGAPAHASAEKGEALFACYAEAAVRLVERMRAWDGTSWDAPA